MESCWRARAGTKPSLYGPFQVLEILTYPFTYTYETTHLLLDASRGHQMILYCCRRLSSISGCGIPRLVFAFEQSRPTWKQSQHLRGYPMDLGSFPVHNIEGSTNGDPTGGRGVSRPFGSPTLRSLPISLVWSLLANVLHRQPQGVTRTRLPPPLQTETIIIITQLPMTLGLGCQRV